MFFQVQHHMIYMIILNIKKINNDYILLHIILLTDAQDIWS